MEESFDGYQNDRLYLFLMHSTDLESKVCGKPVQLMYTSLRDQKLLALKHLPVLVFVCAFSHRSKIVQVQFASLFISSLLKVGYGKVFVRFQKGISAYPRFL